MFRGVDDIFFAGTIRRSALAAFALASCALQRPTSAAQIGTLHRSPAKPAIVIQSASIPRDVGPDTPLVITIKSQARKPVEFEMDVAYKDESGKYISMTSTRFS